MHTAVLFSVEDYIRIPAASPDICGYDINQFGFCFVVCVVRNDESWHAESPATARRVISIF